MPHRSPLTPYHSKRNFKKTAEPFGKRRARDLHAFVVQKHKASTLHYDFRLELDGVLKSWAVPKEPMMDPSVRRLAVQVEDHPVEYADFEGDIPQGEYGAGHVEIWDAGRWTPLDSDPLQAYKSGKLSFELNGKKLKGRWNLVRTKTLAGRSKGKSWLLIKSKDEWAQESSESPEKTAEKRAKLSRRKTKARTAQRAISLQDLPSPELAVLVDQPPEGPEWSFEQKYDGYRILSQVIDGKVRLVSRNGKEWTKRFSPIAEALQTLDCKSALLDGEVIALNEKGLSSFQALQNSLTDSDKGQLLYYIFDLLEVDGEDVRPLPLTERRERLAKLLNEGMADHRIRISEPLVGNGRKLLANACRKGWEGLICKRLDRPYREGRTEDWLKVKCSQRQEFVIVGYTEPKGSRQHLGALLLGSHDVSDGDGLHFVGKVGTGFDRELLKDLASRLKKIEIAKAPLAEVPAFRGASDGIHWVKPELVAEISFTEWTKDGILRHPSFEGLREDKSSNEVTVEKAKPVRKVAARRSPTDREEEVQLTHPERILYPDAEVSKNDLNEYYQLVSQWMLPLIKGRPLSVRRCPEGFTEECFFQQNFKKGLGAGTSLVKTSMNGKKDERLQIDSAEGLTALVQHSVLEMHMWAAPSQALEHPDQLIFDLDPDVDLGWSEVVRGVKILKAILEEHGLATFIKLSGGKGAHVHVPLRPTSSWQDTHDFSEAIAQDMASRHPDLYTASSLKKERAGRIYLDYVRNSRGVTSIAPYSTRSREGAPVAIPIFWDELSSKLKPNHFTVKNAKARLEKLKEDPWGSFAAAAKALPKRL